MRSTAPLDLAELLRLEPLSHADAVHLADPGHLVREVVLAETFERLRRTAPHALVVLHHEAATGGWSLAAALHVAWERNVSAVIVPRSAMSSSSAVLAERLGIALFAIDGDPIDVALTLAVQVSAPQAARASRIALCAERLAEQSSIRSVLGVLNSELAPVPVALVIGMTVAAGRAAAVRDQPQATEVRVTVNDARGRPWATLVASVPDRAATDAGAVESLLRLARLPLLAALAQSQVDTTAREAQEQAAFQLLRQLTHTPAASIESEVDSPDWLAELGWQVEGVNRAVWLSPVRGEPTDELTRLVRAEWQRHRPAWPIVAEDGGWLSWQNSPYDTPATRFVDAVTEAARRHGLVLGVGGAHEGVPGLMRSVTEARLAANVARDDGPGTGRFFDQVGALAALAWLPRDRIVEVAELCLPDLMAAKDRDALVATVLAVLDCGGSLSQASERLGVHRNTVLSRIARAKDLGLTFGDPTRRLALHVVCHALA